MGGVRPQFVVNYWRDIALPLSAMPSISVGAVYAEEFGSPRNYNFYPYDAFGAGRKISLVAQTAIGGFASIKLAALHSGSEKIGAQYSSVSGEIKKIGVLDTLGAYVYADTSLLPYTTLFADFAWRGLVADTNASPVHGGGYITDSGSGNRLEAQLGATVGIGSLSVKPLVRYRQPLEAAYDRSLLYGSPFIVGLGNRQQLDVEVEVTYDGEGGTYFWDWDNSDAEQAPVAVSLAGIYTPFAGATDLIPYMSNNTILNTNADGTKEYATQWYDGGALPEQQNLWQARLRVVANPLKNLRLVGTVTGGTVGAYTGNANGTDHEKVTFLTASLAARWNNLIGGVSFALNGFGEEWWHNANNTFPMQFTVDLAYGFKKPSFLDKANRIGISVTGRTYNANTADPYGALPAAAHEDGDATKTLRDGIMYMECSLYVNIGLK